jgi:hypothetical protein
MAKTKKVKTLTSYLAGTWELNNMNQFQITFGQYIGEDWQGSISFGFESQSTWGGTAVQTSIETSHVRDKFFYKIFPTFKKSKYGGGEFDMTVEEMTKLEDIFRELGYEVEIHTEKVRPKTWHWLRINDTDATKIEEQLKQIAAKWQA